MPLNIDPRLQSIVSQIKNGHRSNPEYSTDQQLQKLIVDRGLKKDFSEADLIIAARDLGVDPGDFLEELASWL